MAGTDGLIKTIGKAIGRAAKSRVTKYRDKRDPALLAQKLNPKATYGSEEGKKAVKEVKKYGRAKVATAIGAGYAIGATEAPSKVWDGAKYVYQAVTEKNARDKASKTKAKSSTTSSDKNTAARKVTAARKEQVAANKQKVKAAGQQYKATTNKEKVAANKTKVTANARMVAANKKKVEANKARYKKG